MSDDDESDDDGRSFSFEQADILLENYDDGSDIEEVDAQQTTILEPQQLEEPTENRQSKEQQEKAIKFAQRLKSVTIGELTGRDNNDNVLDDNTKNQIKLLISSKISTIQEAVGNYLFDVFFLGDVVVKNSKNDDYEKLKDKITIGELLDIFESYKRSAVHGTLVALNVDDLKKLVLGKKNNMSAE